MESFSDFHFLRPLFLLLLFPLIIFIWALANRKLGNSNWERVCDPKLIPYILINGQSKKRRWPLWLLLTIAILVIVALAGPSWKQLPQPVFRSQSSLVAVLDLSQSMNVNDLKPSRMERARFKVIDLLKSRVEGETALLVYAGSAFTVTPLTDDHATIISQLPALTPELMPVQGARADKAITLAVDLLKQSGNSQGDILLITDEIDPVRDTLAAKQANKQGYRVSVLGVGTQEGAPIPLANGGILKNQSGTIIIPILKERDLQTLASNGGGIYVTINIDSQDIDELVGLFSTLDRRQAADKSEFKTDSWQEQGPWLLLIVLPLTALLFRRGYLFCFVFLLMPIPEPVSAIDWDDLWLNPDQQAHKALTDGDAEVAIKKFHDPDWKAAAQYRAGQYQQAIESIGNKQDADSLYNKANSFAKLGKLEEALQSYEEAIESDPNHEDAIYNRDIVRKALEEQQQQNQQQNQQQPSDKNNSADSSEQQSENQQQQDEPSQQSQQSNGSQSNEQNDQQQEQVEEEQHQASQGQEQKDQQAQEEIDNEQQADQQQQEIEQQEQQTEQTDPQLAEATEQKELDQAAEQWLSRIPYDPGGLLRRKFLYQYQQRAQQEQFNRNEQNW